MHKVLLLGFRKDETAVSNVANKKVKRRFGGRPLNESYYYDLTPIMTHLDTSSGSFS
jgi:hypothetical protein